MRTALRQSIYLAVPAVAALVLCGWWIHLGLEEAAEVSMQQTVRLLGQELAKAVDRTFDGRLQLHSKAAAEDVLTLLDELTTGSDLINGLVVVDADGHTAASSHELDGHDELPLPIELFSKDTRPRLVHRSRALQEGDYELDVPLFHGEEVAGYLHLRLDTAILQGVYSVARLRLLITALVTAAILLVAAFAFDLQLRQRATSLAGTVERIVRGGEGPKETPKEFSPVLEVAGRLGYELRRERQDRSQVRRRLAQLTDLMDEGVALLGEGGRLELANQRALEMLGIGEGERLDDERIAELLGPVRRAAVSTSGPAESAVDLELPGVGERPARALRVQVYAMEENGHDATLLLLRDRNVLASLETDLRMATQLRSLTHLFMGVAHDLKAPLNAIVLNLEVLRRQLQDDGVAEATLGTMAEELRRLERLLQLLLSQTAPPQQSPQEVDLVHLVARTAEIIAPQARQQQVMVQTRVECESATVHGYADQLRQAILNLAINGLEAMPDGGRLDLVLRREGEEYCLEVCDTGTGIPDEVRSRIFDLHFTTKGSGTGVGLHVVRRILESLGGRVEVVETGDEGTKIGLCLPVSETKHTEEVHG